MKKTFHETKNLIYYAYGLLDNKARARLEAHIELCPDCKQTLDKLKILKQTVIQPSTLQAPDRSEIILQKIKEQEARNNKKRTSMSVSLTGLKNRWVLQAAWMLACFAITFAIAISLVSYSKMETMNIVRSFGDIKIQQYASDNRLFFQYDIRKPVRIEVGKGECVLQIGRDKLIQLKADTTAMFYVRTNIQVQLTKGYLIGKVNKKLKKKDLVISADGAVFRIVGTVFSIKNINDSVECSVQKGKVQARVNEKPYNITNQTSLKINRENGTFSKIPERDEKALDAIGDFVSENTVQSPNKTIIDATPPKTVPVTQFEKITVWNGDDINNQAHCWSSPNTNNVKSTCTFEPNSGVGNSCGLKWHAKGAEWMGFGMSWFSWWPADAGTDVSGMGYLKFKIKVSAFSTAELPQLDAFTVNLRCSGKNKAVSKTVRLSDYSKDFMDGQWHGLTIPLKDMVPDVRAFDLKTVWEFDLGEWSQSNKAFDVVCDDIGFNKDKMDDVH